jgi:hypothetical protein
LKSEKQFIEAVEEGVRADETGDTIPHEVVMIEIDALLANYPASGQ